MIVDDRKTYPEDLKQDDVLFDTPPAYEDINALSLRQPIASSSSHRTSSLPVSRPAKISLSALSPKKQIDVRETVRGIIRDLVKTSSSTRSTTSIDVLKSCASACTIHHLSLARILQERSMEGHAPLYWAIVSRRSSHENPSSYEDDTFFRAIITHAAPLSPVGVSELRSGYLVTGSNAEFQRMRSMPGLIPRLGTDNMLLAQMSIDKERSELDAGTNEQEGIEEEMGFGDIVDVQQDEAEAFSVHLQLKMFQRRMRVSSEVSVEFIARSRLWLLVFFVVPSPTGPSSPPPRAVSAATSSLYTLSSVPSAALATTLDRRLPPGAWAMSLTLLDNSPQCAADARFVIPEPPGAQKRPSLVLNLASSRTGAFTYARSSSTPSTTSAPPPFSFPNEIDLFSKPASLTTTFKEKLALSYSTRETQEQSDVPALFAGLEGEKARQLMHDGCPYIMPDETLHGVLEVRLKSSTSDCIIC